jgi:3-oxoacyl-[acyl-carrier-protein] synthase II
MLYLMDANPYKRVAVTGLGVVSSIGESVPGFKEGLFHGKCGIGKVTLFDTKGFPCEKAAEIRKELLPLPLDSRDIRRASRCDLLGMIAVGEALGDSGLNLDAMDPTAIGVVLGGGAGGMLSWETYRRAAWGKKSRPRPSLLLPVAQCALTDLIAGTYDMAGHRATISTACSSSATSIGYGFDLIRSGAQKIIVTGGSESLSELTFAGFNALRVMDPQHCRPFDRKRRGLSLGEGAAILILEDFESAQQRGAAIYAEVLGYATNSDAFHMTSPDPEAKGMRRVMSRAVEAAGLRPGAIDYINAHGTATPINDRTETKAIKEVFGEEHAGELVVSSTKSQVGHCLGAAGALEAVATILALCEQVVPPTIHLDAPDPDCDLDYVPNRARPMTIKYALSNSFAFGGNNTSVVFGRGEI